jgi:tetratricopeptide (TPR) repeat protein
VETLLGGSVRRYGDKLRVSVQLTDVATGYHLWSERYDRDLEDVFAIQDEISESVARALEIMLGENERHPVSKAHTSDAEAYDYYLRGRRFFNQGLKRSLQFARDMFVKASEVDSEYALAYVGIADCYTMLIHLYGESKGVNLAVADRASRRALDLDPRLPQAHSARGFTLWLMDDFENAKVEFETAMEMDPGLSHTRYLYGRACFQRGDFERAARLFEDACRNQEHHEAQFFAAQAHAALDNTEKALIAYRLALRAIERHVELNPDDARVHTMGAVALCRLGERSAGIEWAERALAIDPDDAGIQYNVACLFALEKETDRAIDCLQAAVRGGFAHRDWVEKDPDLDSIRDDPRFKALTWRE